MELDWSHIIILLLLPVAAYSGWWTAKRTLRRSENGFQRRLHPEYFKGLNYVLNEQPDKAIEVFIKMLEVDSETVETHLALGNLFRRRGEVDRAIRIHQNLIARPTLGQEERALALLELGMDYMRSGLLDRAEGLFLELVEDGYYTVQALRPVQQSGTHVIHDHRAPPGSAVRGSTRRHDCAVSLRTGDGKPGRGKVQGSEGQFTQGA